MKILTSAMWNSLRLSRAGSGAAAVVEYVEAADDIITALRKCHMIIGLWRLWPTANKRLPAKCWSPLDWKWTLYLMHRA